jgi:hypothetical protein
MTFAATTLAAVVTVAALIGAQAAASPRPEFPGHVHELELDRSDGHLLVATHTGLYETSLWSRGPTLVGPIGSRRDLTALTSFRQTLYGSARWTGGGPSLGFATSTDHGKVWTAQAVYGHRQLRNLTATQVDGQPQFFAIDTSNSILRSADGGTVWTTVSGPRANAIETASGRLFAATATGVRISTDGGTTWTPAVGPKLHLLARGTPAQGTLAGISAGGAVWRLFQGGWLRTGDAPKGTQALTTVLTGRALTLVVATESGIQRSTDWGTTWDAVTTW